MQMFLEEESSEIWKAVKDGPYIPITVVNGVVYLATKGDIHIRKEESLKVTFGGSIWKTSRT
jgi:hypothetical protein